MVRRVFYRIHHLSREQRLQLLDEMLKKAHFVSFDEELKSLCSGGRHVVETMVGLDKVKRATDTIWRFLSETLDNGLVEYELYCRYDDPDYPNSELFMHVRTDEKLGWELANRYKLKPT